MTTPAPFNLPGYLWDGKRFYKAPPQTKQAPTNPENASISNKRKKAARPTSTKTTREARYRSRGSLHEQLRDLALQEWHTSARDSLHHDINASALSRFESTRIIYPECLPNEEEIVKLSFDELDPAVLRIGGSSGTIATGNLRGREELNEYLGYYPNDEFGFRTNWFAPNKITSLKTSGQRVLATCLGPPAQAIVSTTSNTISMASVTLSPRKTSLWTSAISPSLVALGCDKKVLISTNPERADMESIQTGSKSFGDGTVFSLDVHDDLVFAGVRNGCMRMFDRRVKHSSQGSNRPKSPESSRNELELFIDSPVTNIKLLREDPNRIVLAGMNGSLGVYDLRVASTTPRPVPRSSNRSTPAASPVRQPNAPIISFQGHSNLFSTDFGFDTFRDQFVVAAGQDQRIRLWSLRTGGQPIVPPYPASSSTAFSTSNTSTSSTASFSPAVLSALSSLPSDSRASTPNRLSITQTVSPSPWLRQFDSPIKSIRFSAALDPILAEEAENEYGFSSVRRRKRLEVDGRSGGEGMGGRGEERLPKSLWVADGAGIECFGLK
ncbi:uncharacterized protein JCM6883_004522 [Sporobolomyces salmoneus]|uniref:uncharacterized protein n=1 Tax=Sporobolomyces salmoneus TaxID=183962 RepID=UPI003173AD9A